MSTATTLPVQTPARFNPVARVALALAAVALVAGALALVAWLFAPASSPPPVRNPFGAGVREAAPAAGGIGGMILALQGAFYRSLQGAVSALKQDGTAFWSLIWIGFAYGVFHAAGPGHGKAVISAYLVASGRALRSAVSLSLAAALLQAFIAVALVGVVTIAIRATAAGMNQVTQVVELASFAAVTALGAVLVWRKAGGLIGVAALGRDPSLPANGTCDHVHLPDPQTLERLGGWRERAGVVIAAGIRPCAGALVVLVFALSQGLFAAGIAAALAMALGTALTTSLLAALAVFAKSFALRLAGGRGAAGAIAVAGLELLAAAFVLVLGAALLAGLWTTAGS